MYQFSNKSQLGAAGLPASLKVSNNLIALN